MAERVEPMPPLIFGFVDTVGDDAITPCSHTTRSSKRNRSYLAVGMPFRQLSDCLARSMNCGVATHTRTEATSVHVRFH